MYLHQMMGPFAQGPVALIARQTDECVFSADAMGLRPLWQVETEDDYVFSSEPGVVSVAKMCSEPKPLAPGEKALVLIDRAKRNSTLHPHDEMLRIVRDRWLVRNGADAVAGYERALETGGPLEGQDVPGYSDAGPEEPVKVSDRVLAGFGWQRDDVKLVQQMASNGAEPVGSLGYDGPLAALSPERQNLADYFKETVAVVTNPALDRERELEHFSTRTLLGRRPSPDNVGEDTGTVELGFPVVLPEDRPRAQHLPARGPLGGVRRSQRCRRHLPARVGDDPRRDRADQTGSGEEGPQRLRAAGPHRPHRL
jgi:glutamate synthase (NADPH/NADH) large chain